MRGSTILIALTALLSSEKYVNGFSAPSIKSHRTSWSSTSQNGASIMALRMVASTSSTDASTSAEPELKKLTRDRYIATNRFNVRRKKGPKFEKRWATRKSRLASLDGFRYFHLMRRVTMDENEPEEESSFGNYVSFTIWQEKKHFNAWRKGDAFIEAHGGKSIGSFLSTMISSARLLRGPPRPAFYDGLLLQSITPDSVPETEDGWRKIESESLGKEVLPAECFVACNQFYVPSENGAAFEQRWAGRVSKLKECDGFITFTMLRRDANAKGHGTVEMKDDEPSYMSSTIWKDREAFEAWRSGTAFKAAHGASPPSSSPSPQEGESKKGKPPAAGKPLWSRPPKPVFYEGTLVISNEEGA